MAVPDGEIMVHDPRAADVRALLQRHLEFAYATTPAEHVHALDLDGLLDPAVTFYGYRRSGRLLAVGALRHLDRQHGELKSMHTAAEARGQGIGGAMLAYLIGVARDRGLRRLSLETGSWRRSPRPGRCTPGPGSPRAGRSATTRPASPARS